LPVQRFAFMSPEQSRGEVLDFRSDVYSLGAVLFYMVTGKLLFDLAREELAIPNLDDIPSLLPSQENISENLARLIQKMLAVSPEDRCKSIAEIRELFHLASLPHKKKVKNVKSSQSSIPETLIVLCRKYQRLIFGCLVILFFILGYVCVSKTSQSTSYDASKIYKKSALSVVSLEVGEKDGSGVVLSYKKQKFILTSEHVIRGHAFALVKTKAGKSFTGRIFKVDKLRDLAIITIPEVEFPLIPIPMGKQSQIKIGDDVFVIGHPRGYQWTMTRGTISGLDFHQEVRKFHTDAAINPGNSGGPAINSRGEMIGLTTYILAETNDMGFAVSIGEIKEFCHLFLDPHYSFTPKK